MNGTLTELPLIHLQTPFVPEDGSHFQGSFSCPLAPCAWFPLPPNSQAVPEASVQVMACGRSPGRFVEAGTPIVP